MTTCTTTAGTTMRAIIQENYGEGENVLRLGQTSRPAIGDREVLLRVHAAGVDRGVWHLMVGLPYPVRLAGYGIRAPRASVPGREVAGRVDAVGADVTTLAVGDEVFGIAGVPSPSTRGHGQTSSRRCPRTSPLRRPGPCRFPA